MNTFSHLNNTKNNEIFFNNSNEISHINNQKRKKGLESHQYNKMINNNRYNTKQLQNIELANKNLNYINYNFIKDYSYEVINGNMINNLVTNKSANKNENSNRKKGIIFHQKIF